VGFFKAERFTEPNFFGRILPGACAGVEIVTQKIWYARKTLTYLCPRNKLVACKQLVNFKNKME
jgi:hypothetical protein